MNVAVVILNYNGRQLLEKFIPSVVSFSQEASIYVIDNASTDTSVSFLKTKYPQIGIIQLDKNYGFAGGYNRGLSQIEADLYVLINSDLEVTSNWLSPVIKVFKKNPDVAIAQPKVKNYNNKNKFDYAGAAGGFIDMFGYPYCDGRILFDIEEDKGQYNESKFIFWASGACFFIRSSVFNDLGGFDSDFFAHQEEIDLCWRAHHKNYKVLYVPLSEVFHLGGGSLTYQSAFKTYLNFRNNLLMLLKNLPVSFILPVIFTRLILDGISGVVFIFKGRPKHTWAIVRAHFSFYKRIFSAIKKRPDKTIDNYFQTFSIFLKRN